MSKYFSNDTNLSKYDMTETNSVDVTMATHIPSELSENITHEQKELLNKPYIPMNTDEHISYVREQSNQIKKMVETYSEESKQTITNNFSKFAPAELFEKLNQIIFILANINNRLTALEDNSKEAKKTNPSINEAISDPKELYEFHKRQELNENRSTAEQQISVSEAQQIMKKILNGENPLKIPDEGFVDKSMDLEELIPNLPDDAYQAAYASMAKAENTFNSPGEKIITTNMRNLTGF